MFDTDTETQDRGQVGIGTLIVFIALVLVAAIAAGVLINTAGFLQSQAESTGQESTDQVANNLEVLSVNATSSGGSSVQEIGALVSLGAGSDAVDLSEMTIEYVGPQGADTLVAGSEDLGSANDDVLTADPAGPAFGVETADGTNTGDGAGNIAVTPSSAPVLTDSSQRLRVIIQYTTGGSTVLGEEPGPGDDVTLTLTTADGSQRTVDITIPDPLSSGDNRV